MPNFDPLSNPGAKDLARLQEHLKQRGISAFTDNSFLDLSETAGELVLNSFTGSDITCSIVMPRPKGYDEYLARKGIDPSKYPTPTMKTFAELETISISSARSVNPVRRLGEHHVHQYTRGGRTIAGSMVFTTLSRDVFADFYRIHPAENFTGQNARPPMHVDQIPPFHVLINAANEYGMIANAALINVHLTNFGTTMSVHDLKTESTYTYVAQFFFPFVQDYRAFQNVVLAGLAARDEALSEKASVSTGYDGPSYVSPLGEADDPQRIAANNSPETRRILNNIIRNL